MKTLWLGMYSYREGRFQETDKTTLLVFDPVYIYKNPDYDTRAAMKTVISGIEKNILHLKRMSTPAPHIFFCLQRAHAVVGIQTNILQHIMTFLSFDIVWTSDNDDEKDTRRRIFVNPCREKITILNPDAEQTNRIVVSRNFEYMKNLMISRAELRLRNRLEGKHRLLRVEESKPYHGACCSVQ